MNQTSDPKKLATATNTKCPKCDGEIALAENTEEGEIVNCDECGAELEVTKIEPLTLEDAPPTQEDWGE